MVSERNTWILPPSVDQDQAAKFVRYFNAGTWYSAVLQASERGRSIDLTRRSVPPPHFTSVGIDAPVGDLRRWEPLRLALREWVTDLENVSDRAFALEAVKRLAGVDPTARDPMQLHYWLSHMANAVATADAALAPDVVAWIEAEFTKHFGENDAVVFVRSHEAVRAMHMVETMAKLEVMDVRAFAAGVNAGASPPLLAEQSHGALTANHFLVPTAIAYPDWIGTGAGLLAFEVLFILRTPRQNMPLLDARHLNIWRGAINAWWDLSDLESARPAQWTRLTPARPAGFIKWYVGRLNNLLARLTNLGETATRDGKLRPLAQVSVTRTLLQLQDIVGRMLITSDHFARVSTAIQVLARFDDLEWEFRRILDPEWLAQIVRPLDEDPEVGAVFGAYARTIQANVIRGLLESTVGRAGAHATITLGTGRVTRAADYLGDYLKAVRDTVHGFNAEKLQRILGPHRGILPVDLPQYAVVLWLLFLADPDPILGRLAQRA